MKFSALILLSDIHGNCEKTVTVTGHWKSRLVSSCCRDFFFFLSLQLILESVITFYVSSMRHTPQCFVYHYDATLLLLPLFLLPYDQFTLELRRSGTLSSWVAWNSHDSKLRPIFFFFFLTHSLFVKGTISIVVECQIKSMMMMIVRRDV